jgi:transposase
MAWRQGQSYSDALRARVLAAVDEGMAGRAAARLFRVSVSSISKAVIRRPGEGRARRGAATGRASARRRRKPLWRLLSRRTPTSPWRRCQPGSWPSTRFA